jgi:hypothetical protein
MNRQERRQYGREHGIPTPPPESQQAFPQVQFGPVPTITQVGVAETPEGSRVFLGVSTPIAPMMGFFLSVEHAKQLAAELAQASMSADTGLQIIGAAGPVDPGDLVAPKPEQAP